jgi:hypothetical protein
MYECAQRFKLEEAGLMSEQRQAKCYLAVLNCLRLVSADYAWIVKPNLHSQVKLKFLMYLFSAVVM